MVARARSRAAGGFGEGGCSPTVPTDAALRRGLPNDRTGEEAVSALSRFPLGPGAPRHVTATSPGAPNVQTQRSSACSRRPALRRGPCVACVAAPAAPSLSASVPRSVRVPSRRFKAAADHSLLARMMGSLRVGALLCKPLGCELRGAFLQRCGAQWRSAAAGPITRGHCNGCNLRGARARAWVAVTGQMRRGALRPLRSWRYPAQLGLRKSARKRTGATPLPVCGSSESCDPPHVACIPCEHS